MPTNWGARTFVSASSQYLVNTSFGSGPATWPNTLAAWFYPTSAVGTQAIVALGDNNAIDSIRGLRVNAVANKLTLLERDTVDTFGEPASTVNYNANAWNHGAGVFTASNSRTVYLNGGNSASDATSLGTVNLNDVAVGAWQRNATQVTFFNGRVADVAYWNVALTAAEILALANGARPFTIRPQSLLLYYPLDGLQSPEPNLAGNGTYNLTLQNSPSADFGPPLAPFTPRWPQFPFVTAAPTFNPAWARGKNVVIEGVAT
jgi:hypothetical protein